MKLIARIIIIGILTYLLMPFFPWWTIFIIAFSTCYFWPSSGLNAFVAGFLGSGLVWLGKAWLLDFANESIFSGTISDLIGLDQPVLLILISGIIGGLSGGLGALSGVFFKQLFVKKKSNSLYN